ncbi:MAG: TonB-dependent receptor [Pseudomonadota bacterium]
MFFYLRLRAACLLPILIAVTPCYGDVDSENEEIENARAKNHIEEVIVTATKRDTSLQELDRSATVLNRQDLLDARVTDIRRIDDLVPNVQFNDSGQIGGVYIAIRGVESNPFIVNRAAVYIDGIPFRQLNNSVLAQLEGVEVLRGPQSTLYGANTSSGLILLKTRAPSDETIADASLTASTFGNGESLQFTGFFGAPIIEDTLSGSLSLRLTDADFFVENIGATPQGPGQYEEAFFQARLRWTPSQDLTVNANAYYIETAAPGVYRFDGYPVEIDAYNAIYSEGSLSVPGNPLSIPAVNGDLRADDFSFVNDAPKRADIEELVMGISATQQLKSGQIDVAFSHRTEDISDKGFDLDNTNGPFTAGAQWDDITVTTGELRFTSADTGQISYSVGVSFYLEDEREALGPLLGTGGLDDFLRSPDQRVESFDWGVFGSLSYTPESLEKLTLTVGLRYDNAERTTSQEAGVLDLGFAEFLFQELNLQENFEEVLYRFSARYEVSSDLTLYSNVATGYTPGGFNIAAAQEDVLADVIRFDKEEIVSIDAGIRLRSSDRRWQFSAAAFYLEADNWQEITALEDEQGNVLSTSIVTSRSAVESRGLEFEGRANITSNLQLTANLGTVDAEYTDFAGVGADLALGNFVKLIPEYDGNIALRWQLAGNWFVRGEVNFLGDTRLDEGIRQGFDVNAEDTQQAVEIYGLQMGYESERFSARLFGENLTDERRFSGGAFPNGVFPADGLLYGPLDAPRVVGLELNISI